MKERSGEKKSRARVKTGVEGEKVGHRGEMWWGVGDDYRLKWATKTVLGKGKERTEVGGREGEGRKG